ncbi:MAG: hypothetical protein ACI35S_03635 [Anaeroplasma sp.]
MTTFNVFLVDDEKQDAQQIANEYLSMNNNAHVDINEVNAYGYCINLITIK